jgi:hypothetical protein
MKINRRKLLSLLGTSPVLLAGTAAKAEPKKKSAHNSRGGAEKFTAVSPKGTPPPVHRYSMAPRLDSLNGKTIYLVDTGFFGGGLLLQQMQDWFQQNMPNVKTVFRKKAGGWAADDPPLWAEIKSKGNAAIMAIGH